MNMIKIENEETPLSDSNSFQDLNHNDNDNSNLSNSNSNPDKEVNYNDNDFNIQNDNIEFYRRAVDLNHNDLTKYDDLALAKIMSFVKCQMMISGYKSILSDYVFCKTCDSEEKNAICIECSKVCHQGHKLTGELKIAAICNCGILCHRSQNMQEEKLVETNICPFSEWSIVSKTAVYFSPYEDENAKYCLFCANICHKDIPLIKKFLKNPIESGEQFNLSKTQGPIKEIKSLNLDNISRSNINMNSSIPVVKNSSSFICNCKDEVHKEKNNMVRRFNEIDKASSMDFNNLLETQVINTIVDSPRTFSMLFKPLKRSLQELFTKIKDPNQVLDSGNISSGLAWALQNLSNLQSISRNNYYFSNKAKTLLSKNFVYILLCKKFDYKSIPAWATKSQVLQAYTKFIFCKEFASIPDFSFKDLINLHPLHRLMIIRSIMSYGNIADNVFIKLIDPEMNENNTTLLNPELLLKIMSKYNNLTQDNLYYLNILNSIFQMFCLYAKFNLIDLKLHNQLFSCIDELFNKYLNVVNRKEDQLKSIKIKVSIVNSISQILFFTVCYNNDYKIKKYLSKSIDISKLSFAHSNEKGKNEIGMLINKNLINSMNFFKTNYQLEYFDDLKRVYQCIDEVKALNLENFDSYQLSINHLKSSNVFAYNLFLNKELFDDLGYIWSSDTSHNTKQKFGLLNAHNKSFLSLEKDFLKFIFVEVETLEHAYDDFFRFQITINELISSFIKSIENFFTYIGNDFSLPYNENIPSNVNKGFLIQREEYERKIQSKEHYDSLPMEIIQILINKSYYVFTVFKILKLITEVFKKNLKFTNDSYSQSLKLFDIGLTTSLLRLLHFLSDNNIDNVIFLTGSFFVKIISELPIEIIKPFLLFILSSFGKIFNEKKQLNNVIPIIEAIEQIITDPNNADLEIELIEILLQIIDVLSKLPVLDKNKDKQLRLTIKKLTTQFPVFCKFKEKLYDNNFEELIEEKEKEAENESVDLSNPNANVNNVNNVNRQRSKNKEGHESLKINNINIPLSHIKNVNSLNFSVRLSHNFNPSNSYIKIGSNLDNQAFSFIYIRFLKIVNELFDQDSTVDETQYLMNILNPNEIIDILTKNKSLFLPLRTELLMYFRMAYIDVIINKKKLIEYRSLLINNIQLDEFDDSQFRDIFRYKLTKSLLNINDTLGTLENEVRLIKNELMNFEIIILESKVKDPMLIIDYFEIGIMKPLKIFINKFMSIVYLLSGYSLIDLYEVTVYFLKLKSFLLENKEVFINKDNYRVFNEIILQHQSSSIGKLLSLDDNNINLTKLDLEKLLNPNFEIFNHQLVYSIFDKHINDFFDKPELVSILPEFSKYKQVQLEVIHAKNSKGEMIEKSLKELTDDIIDKYAKDKVFINESALFETLNQQNLLFKSSYRYMFIKALLFIATNKRFDEKYTDQLIWDLFKTLQFDTKSSQTEMMKIYEDPATKDTMRFDYLESYFLTNFLSIIFYSSNPTITSKRTDYFQALTLIKFLKYLCEEHNQYFQTLFIKDLQFFYLPYKEGNTNTIDTDETKESTESITLFNYMLCVLGKILTLSGWINVSFNQEDMEIAFYYDIFFSIVEFLIEMIQGTTQENLESLIDSIDSEKKTKSFLSSCLYELKILLYHDKANSLIIYQVRIAIINFILAFLEEPNTPLKVNNLLISIFSPLVIFESICITMKKLYIKLIKQENSNNPDLAYSEKDYDMILFDKKLCSFFENRYFSDIKLSSDNPEFELSNRMFQYVVLLATEYKNEEAKIILDKVNNFNESQLTQLFLSQNSRNDEGFMYESDNKENISIDITDYQNFFLITFFMKITKSVWINKDDKLSRVIYTLNPLVKYLSKNTKEDFYNNVNRSNRYNKLSSLTEASNIFFEEIMFNYKNTNKTKYEKILSKLDSFKTFEYINFIFILIINVIMMISLFQIDVNQGLSTGLNNVVPISSRGYYYYQDNFYRYIILVTEIILVVFDGLVIILWLVSKFPLHYRLESLKYLQKKKRQMEAMKEEDKDDEISSNIELSKYDKVRIILIDSFIKRKEISIFLISFILTMFSISNDELRFIFSFEILLVVSLSETMMNIFKAISIRGKQLISIAIFAMICLNIFGNIGYFWFYIDYNKSFDINGVKYQENQCEYLIQCFMFNFRYGLGTDGGINENLLINYYFDGNNLFAGRFFNDLIFYLIVKLSLLSIVLGNVVDASAELREESHKLEEDMHSVCFICGDTRDSLEKDNIHFEDHIKNDHNIWEYCDYLIGLKFVDIQETNAVNSYVMEHLQERSIAWFPSEKK